MGGPDQATADELELIATAAYQESASLEDMIIFIGLNPDILKENLEAQEWPWGWPRVYIWFTRPPRSNYPSYPPRIVVWKHYGAYGSPKTDDFEDLVTFRNPT